MGRSMNWKSYVLLTVALILALFVIQNHKVVEVQFLFWSFKASRAFVLFFTLLIGMAIGWLAPKLLRKNPPSTER